MSAPARVEVFLSLIQPWATLMAIEAKLNETRSWRTHFRGWFAIHASKGFPRECRDLCYLQPFASVLAKAGYNGPADLPVGRVLAVTELVDCVPTEKIRAGLSLNERAFGDYSDGRFAFVTRGVKRLRWPMAMKGERGFRRLPVPVYPIRAEELEP